MNRDDIIRVARDAGLPLAWISEYGVRLAALVAAAEREACAKVCDDTDVVRFWHGGMEHDDGNRTLGNAAAAIRARGEA